MTPEEWTAVRLSLLVATTATLASLPFGVAIAWLLTRPHVVATIASARSTGQLAEILPAVKLELTPAETGLLSSATEPA